MACHVFRSYKKLNEYGKKKLVVILFLISFFVYEDISLFCRKT